MFQPIHTGSAMPVGFYNVDFTSEFQAGMIGGLTVVAGEVVMSVANGTTIPPYGILDDFKSASFQRTIRNDVTIISVPEIARGTDSDGDIINTIDVNGVLDHSNIIGTTYASDIDLTLNTTNGMITAGIGTKLNFDLDGDGAFDSVKIISSYVYRVPNIPGDDTTAASGKVTIWNARGEYVTDQYVTNVAYPINATLFCDPCGRFTTNPVDDCSPGIAMVTATPTHLDSTLQLLWF